MCASSKSRRAVLGCVVDLLAAHDESLVWLGLALDGGVLTRRSHARNTEAHALHNPNTQNAKAALVAAPSRVVVSCVSLWVEVAVRPLGTFLSLPNPGRPFSGHYSPFFPPYTQERMPPNLPPPLGRRLPSSLARVRRYVVWWVAVGCFAICSCSNSLPLPPSSHHHRHHHLPPPLPPFLAPLLLLVIATWRTRGKACDPWTTRPGTTRHTESPPRTRRATNTSAGTELFFYVCLYTLLPFSPTYPTFCPRPIRDQWKSDWLMYTSAMRLFSNSIFPPLLSSLFPPILPLSLPNQAHPPGARPRLATRLPVLAQFLRLRHIQEGGRVGARVGERDGGR